MKPTRVATLTLTLAALGTVGCPTFPAGLDSYCPDAPTADGCPEGSCIAYPCVAYCLEYHPNGEDIPDQGMGAWCDDFEPGFDFGDFCRQHLDEVERCAEWCLDHEDRCNDPRCGDDHCDDDETAVTCPEDCPAECGDGTCTHDEDTPSCPADCTADCGDEACTHDETTENCPEDCPAECDDGACTHDETAASCEVDCPPVCGDEACTHDETAASCEGDCPAECGDGDVTHDEQCEPGDSDTCTTSCASTGSLTCEDCRWSGCAPPEESCNGLDDDCDGDEDESFDCALGETAGCSTSCGTTGSWSCTSSCTWPATCSPPAESCNGEDDDCDEAVDEDFDCFLGEEAECDTSCGTTGTMICDGSCTWPVTCSPPLEVCNSVDDDCDSSTDEGCACRLSWNDELTMSGFEVALDSWTASWDEVLVVSSGGKVYRFDGSEWTTETLPPPSGHIYANARAIWGSSPEELWVAGAAGYLARNRGSGWRLVSAVTDAELVDLWGTAADDVFAVGTGGVIIHYDGSSWTEMASETSNDLSGVWGWSSSGVLAVGTSGTVRRYDGGTWSAAASIGATDLTAIWGRSEAAIFVVGAGQIAYSDDGGDSWVDHAVTGTMRAVWGGPANNDHVYVVGDGAQLHRYEGRVGILYDVSNWNELDAPSVNLRTVTGSSTENVFVANRTISHRCGAGW